MDTRAALAAAVCLALSLGTSSASSSSASSEWWVYLADYDGQPGSIRVDLGLRRIAPVDGFGYVVITGPAYSSPPAMNGLPSVDDLDRLNELQTEVVSAIEARGESIYAGTFSHNSEQLHYVYVRDPAGVSEAVQRVYAGACPACKTYLNIKPDSAWSAYRQFLFPNQATQAHHGLKL